MPLWPEILLPLLIFLNVGEGEYNFHVEERYHGPFPNGSNKLARKTPKEYIIISAKSGDLANRWILRNERDRLGGNFSSTNGLRDPKFVVERERNSTDAVSVSPAEVDHKLEATTAKLDPKYGDNAELDGISSFGGFYSSDEFSPQNQTLTKRLRRQIGAETTLLAKNSVQDGLTQLTDNNVSDFLLLPPLIDIWNSSKNLNETDHNTLLPLPTNVDEDEENANRLARIGYNYSTPEKDLQLFKRQQREREVLRERLNNKAQSVVHQLHRRQQKARAAAAQTFNGGGGGGGRSGKSEHGTERNSHPEESEMQPYSSKGKNPWSVRSPGQSSLLKSTYNYGGGLEETDPDSPTDADSLVQTGETSHGKGKEQESSDGGEKEKASDNSEKRPSGKVIEQQQPQQELARLEQVITGIPDLSDPCFRRYANSIIVNAQPYERRSSISLVNCKTQCLRSQSGQFSCHSFVYDNLNNVCDLFAHVGDQSPARLLRFQSRDYFEPTSAISCYPSSQNSAVEDLDAAWATPLSATTLSSSTGGIGNAPTVTTLDAFSNVSSIDIPTATTKSMGRPIVFPSKKPPEKGEESTTPSTNAAFVYQHKSAIEPTAIGSISEVVPQTAGGGKRGANAVSDDVQCGAGKVARFLRTADFELYGHNNLRMTGISLNECLDLCASNVPERGANGSAPTRCNSFEFTQRLADDGECILTTESAVPVGNGQLKQRTGTDYYEKICISQQLAGECQAYNRFPQMILVGFAETVVDAPSLQHCFDICLNSRQLYGFKCNSGMYYFEEPQLGCILNTEDRYSQLELFTAETSDLVDYFEVTKCLEPSVLPRRRPSTSLFSTDKKTRNRPSFLADQSLLFDDSGSRINGFKKDFVDTASHFPNEKGRSSVAARKNRPSLFSAFNRSPAAQQQHLGWTEWSTCSRPSNGLGHGNEPLLPTMGSQTRWRICPGDKFCAKEERNCQLIAVGLLTDAIVSAAKSKSGIKSALAHPPPPSPQFIAAQSTGTTVRRSPGAKTTKGEGWASISVVRRKPLGTASTNTSLAAS